jgi:endonuclease/exonuclease/phosphatase family metal-dependent hydrolase
VPERIRIVNWNIKVGMQRGLDAVRDTLRELHPDVVLLQEVDDNTVRSKHVDQARALAEGLGAQFDYAFAPALELQGGSYGIAMLSRLPFQAAGVIELSNSGTNEPRTAIDAQLCAGPSPLRVVTHHADNSVTGSANSCNEILDTLLRSPLERTIFAGDLNQPPTESGPTACVDAGLLDVLAERDPTPTFSTRRIDYFFVGRQLAEQVVDAKVVQTDASDHELIVMDLRMR